MGPTEKLLWGQKNQKPYFYGRPSLNFCFQPKEVEHINKFVAFISRAIDLTLTNIEIRSKTSKIRRKPLNQIFPFLKHSSAKINLDTH